MSPKTLFRTITMLTVLGGGAYAATRIDDLPPVARGVVGRIGKWLQSKAGATDAPVLVAAAAINPPNQSAGSSFDTPFNPAANDSASDIAARSDVSPPDDAPRFVATEVPPIVSDVDDSFDDGTPADAFPIDAAPSPRYATIPPQGNTANSIEMLEKELQALGATNYLLEKWGAGGHMRRFQCAMVVGGDAHSPLRQHFEAVAGTGEEAMRRVVAQIHQSRAAVR